MKRCTVSVINDLATDQRVRKICHYLVSNGFDVLLIGRVLPKSPPLQPQPYRQIRMRLLFKKGPIFYAFYNIRLFYQLLIHDSDLLISNDLDTLLPNFLVSRIKKIPLVYDSHEYFTEVPELQGRFARKIWILIEKFIFPKLKYVFTVNDSIAGEYEKLYGIRPLVVRNLPENIHEFESYKKTDLGIEDHTKIIILQGSGINVERGGEEAVLAMKNINNAVLLIVGTGDVIVNLKKMVEDYKLKGKVKFIPRQTPENLRKITKIANIGLSLDKDTNLNYRYSLPNKIFDYIQCGVPVLASDLPEVRNIVEGFNVGRILRPYTVEALVKLIKLMLVEDDKAMLRQNLANAAKKLVWSQNIEVLDSVYMNFKPVDK